MPLFDTHAHLDDPQLLPQLDQFLEQADAEGLIGITAIGTTVASSRNCVTLAETCEPVFAAVGIHPNECHHATPDHWDIIRHLTHHPKVVAIGETGLDRHWDRCPFEVQQQWFSRHIDLSFETGLPLVIHMRDCEQEMVAFLERHLRNGRILGILHSFTGSWETAERCLDWGMYLSFAGMVTFKKSNELRAVAQRVPDDRLLIETDSPYLTPHPHRGKRPNHPAMVRYTAECLAEVRGISVAALGELTTQNAQTIFQCSR